MPKVGSTKTLAKVEDQLDPEKRFVDLAVRLRVLNLDGTPGRILEEAVGGRWDTWEHRWVEPTPSDLRFTEWTIQEQQIPVFLGIADDVIFVAILAGRQAGKSRVGIMEVLKDAIRWPGRESFIVSLNYTASSEPEETFTSLLDPAWGVTPNREEKTWTFPHGHRVLFRSAEAIDTCRGPSAKTLLLEEVSRMSHSVFVSAVGMGAASKDFRVIFPTTPRRECRWFAKAVREWGTRARCAVVHLRTEDNPRRNRELLELLRSEMPADLYAQEFEGKLVVPEHAVWYLFDRALHLRRPGDLPERLRFGLEKPPEDWTREYTEKKFGRAANLLMGWDFGKEAVVVAKVFRETRRLLSKGGTWETHRKLRVWIVGELVSARTTTEHHAALVVQKFGADAIVIHDAMGNHERADGRGVKASTAPVKLLREAGFTRVVSVAEANPDVDNSIRACLRLLLDMNGDTRLFFDPDACPDLVDAMENQERGPNGEIVLDGRQHVADALRYLVWRTFPVIGTLPKGWTRATDT